MPEYSEIELLMEEVQRLRAHKENQSNLRNEAKAVLSQMGLDTPTEATKRIRSNTKKIAALESKMSELLDRAEDLIREAGLQ